MRRPIVDARPGGSRKDSTTATAPPAGASLTTSGRSAPLIVSDTRHDGQMRNEWQESDFQLKARMHCTSTRSRSKTVTGAGADLHPSYQPQEAQTYHSSVAKGNGFLTVEHHGASRTGPGRARSNSAGQARTFAQLENTNGSAVRRKVSWGNLRRDRDKKDKSPRSSPAATFEYDYVHDGYSDSVERKTKSGTGTRAETVSAGLSLASRSVLRARERSLSRERSFSPIAEARFSTKEKEDEFEACKRSQAEHAFASSDLVDERQRKSPVPEKSPGRSPMLKGILKRTTDAPAFTQTPKLTPSFTENYDDSETGSDCTIVTPRVQLPSKVHSPFPSSSVGVGKERSPLISFQDAFKNGYAKHRKVGTMHEALADEYQISPEPMGEKAPRGPGRERWPQPDADSSTPEEHIQTVLKSSAYRSPRLEAYHDGDATSDGSENGELPQFVRHRNGRGPLAVNPQKHIDMTDHGLRKAREDTEMSRNDWSRHAISANHNDKERSKPRLSQLRQAAFDRAIDDEDEETEEQKRSSTLKPNWAGVNRESLLVLNADAQRRAFGIPPSVSEDVGALSTLESQNSVDVSAYSDEQTFGNGNGAGYAVGCGKNDHLDLSNGAEQLFQSLGIGKAAARPESFSGRANTRTGRRSWRSSMVEAEKYLRYNASPAAPLSASSSESSISKPDLNSRQWQHQEREHDAGFHHSNKATSWRKTLSTPAYMSLLEKYGQAEMDRQEVIWQLCESEFGFLKSMRTALKLFVQPLLGKRRMWADGVPDSVARLLDWFEDIFQLHAQIGAALQQARSSQYPVVLRVAETLRAFVPKLEVYQPYIVRLDEVVEILEGLTEDGKNEVGEFFRFQSEDPECGGLSFSAFLWLPLTRLGRYLKLFNDLWSLTPPSHVDHLPAFSLVHSATTVVRVMREVKLREEEYSFVKDLVSGIRGFEDEMHLMRRERRLLAHGALQRVFPRKQDIQALYIHGTLTKDSQSSSTTATSKHRKDNMRTRQGVRRRANSLDSCLSEGFSLSSISSLASQTSMDSDDAYLRVSEKAKMKSAARGGRMPIINVTARDGKGVSKPAPVYAFVFSDIALFTVPLKVRRNDARRNGEIWELAEDAGLCRILSVVDHSGRLGYESLIELNILAMDRGTTDEGVSSTVVPQSIFLSFANEESGSDKRNVQIRWLEAFEHCSQATLRSLSYPTYPSSNSKRYLAHGPDGEHDANTRQAVMGILASGLPLPKSPSAQMYEEGVKVEAQEKGRTRTDQEREERGWWALRFQQTLAEMQRDARLKPPPMQKLEVFPTQSNAQRPSVKGRKPLKLGSRK